MIHRLGRYGLVVALVGLVVPVGTSRAQLAMPPSSLFADFRARGVGDIVTILVNESSSATSSAATQSQKTNELAVDSQVGVGFLAFIPGLGINSSADNQYDANSRSNSQSQFTAQIPVRIERVLENGNFLVRGAREVDTDGETRTTVFEGEVRPVDISENNTVPSTRVANVKIFYQGKGVVQQGARAGILTRIINFLF